MGGPTGLPDRRRNEEVHMAITDQHPCIDAWARVPAGAPAPSGPIAARNGAVAATSANRPMIVGRRPETATKAKKTGATWPPLIPPERSSP